MQVDKLEIDATVIKFFNDYVVEEKAEIRKLDLEVFLADKLENLINNE